MKSKENPFTSTENMIDLLSRSTGDYYFLADLTNSLVCFSENAVRDFELQRVSDLSMHVRRLSREDISTSLNELQRLRDKVIDTAAFQFRIETPKKTIRTLRANAKRFTSSENQESELIMGFFNEIKDKEVLSPYAGTLSMANFQLDLDAVFRNEKSGYLLLLDIDNLKTMNFRYGYAYSDDTLRMLISSMKRATDGKKEVYHILGDCFAMILPEMTESDVRQLFFRIQGESSGRMTVSGGCIALDEYPVPNAQTLLQHAESALYISKLSGKAMLNFFSPQDYARKLRNLELQEELEDSIDNGFKGFFLVYQAQVRSRTYELFGAEALLRFRSAKRGVVSPDEFIPILEDTGLICKVGLWVLEEALKTLRRWRQYLPSFMISVNMSYIQMQDENVGYYVLDILKKSGCDGRSLIMEITESSKCMDYPKMNEIFRLLKSAGITISADDFGTGYSGLDRIKMAAFDEIKIDRSFVKSIGKLNRDYHFLSNMITLASDAGLRVVCEGVELEDELEALEKLQPNLLQGFLFSKPITAEEFEQTYFDSTSELFDRRIQKDSYLRQRHAMNMEKDLTALAATTILKPILDTIDDVVYIADIDTGNLIYMNEAATCLIDNAEVFSAEDIHRAIDTPESLVSNEGLLDRESRIGTFKNRNGRIYIEKDFVKVYNNRRLRITILIDVTKTDKPHEELIFQRFEA